MKGKHIALMIVLAIAVLSVSAMAEDMSTCDHSAGWEIVDTRNHRCKSCGETFPHTIEQEVVKATCQSVGYTMDVCKVCGYEGEQYDIVQPDSSAHVWGEWSVDQEATCTTTGKKSHSCSVCGKTEVQDTPLAEHQLQKTVVPPDCINDGYTVYVCANCSYKSEKQDIVPRSAAYHKWGAFSVLVPPTCETAGEQVRVCEICGAKHRQEIAPSGHVPQSVVVQPGCEDGYTVDVCSVCGKELSERRDIVPAVHQWNDWATTRFPDCSTQGEETRTCALCGATETRTLQALGHAFEEVTKQATCLEDGYKARICVRCGVQDGEIYDITPASSVDHVWDEGGQVLVAEPTCTQEGAYLQTCSVCGATRKVAIARRQHQGVETVVQKTFRRDGYTVLVCSKCGKELGCRHDIVPAGMYAAEMRETQVTDMHFGGVQEAVLYTAVSEDGEKAAILELHADKDGNVLLDFSDAWYAKNNICQVRIVDEGVMVTAQAEGKLHAQFVRTQEADMSLVSVRTNLPNDGFDEEIGAYVKGVYTVALSEEEKTIFNGRYISVSAPQGHGLLMVSTEEDTDE